MDNYTLFLIKDDETKTDITNLAGNLSWSDSISTLGTELRFDFARNRDDLNLEDSDILDLGDKLLLLNNNSEVFRGVITDVDWSRYKKSVTAFDYAIYLNKSKTIKQFYDISASKAITQLCSLFDIPVGSIVSISTTIKTIYKDKTIAEIIKDILEQATNELGIKYRMEMREGKLYIEKYSDLVIDPTYQISLYSDSIKVADYVGNVQKSESIQDMRNSILISSSDENSSRIVATAKDSTNIGLYGLLQEVESVDSKNESQAQNIADTKLEDLNRIQEDITIELLGSDLLKAGRIINLTIDSFDMDSSYLIKSTNHTYSNGIHKTSITVEEEA